MNITRHPRFLSAGGRSLFVLEMLPDEGGPRPVGVALLPPFAEEANRARRMMALQAEALAAHGMRAALLDYSCTGDSGGDFGDASARCWREDALVLSDHLRAEGCRSIVWLGTRFGALLAMELAAASSETAGVVLWQPAHSGRQVVGQYLRLLTAARITAGKSAERDSNPRDTLAAGGVVEIAGYALAGRLTGEVEELDLATLGARVVAPVVWYEVGAPVTTGPGTAPGPASLGPASAKIVDGWKRAGIVVECEAMRGEPFWSTIEVTVVPDLIERTTATIVRWCSRA